MDEDNNDQLFQGVFARMGPGDLPATDSNVLDDAVHRTLSRLQASRPIHARYEESEEIGKGGMGLVVRAKDLHLGRPVALKKLRADPSETKLVHRFLAEAQITGQLDHPGIVAVHDVGVDREGVPFFAMQWVRGRDLSQVIVDPPQSWGLTSGLQTLLRVTETLAFAHDRGVIHRDLKPANIMVGRFGEVHVMDWGLARVTVGSPVADSTKTWIAPVPLVGPLMNEQAETLTVDGAIMGTPSYISPEQARGQLNEITDRSDIYSIGAIIYHLVSGRPPFADVAKGSLEVIAAVLKGAPPKLHSVAPDVPAEVIAICDKAMARSPADRYQSAKELSADLSAFLNGQVVEAYRTGGWVELTKWAQRNRLAAGLVAALVAIIVGATWLTGSLVSRTRTLVELSAERELESKLASVDSVGLDVQELEAQLEELWPRATDSLALMEGWLRSVETLRQDADALQVYLNERAPLDDATQGLESIRNRIDRLLETVESPTELTPKSVRSRIETAQYVHSAMPSAAELQRAWRDAFAAAAARGGSGVPRNFHPPYGLVPLGADPESGLHEFCYLPSGTRPSRESGTGNYAVTETTGLVLVLIPGGRWSSPQERGADTPGTSSEPLDGYVVPVANNNWATTGELVVRDFLISKYEMTQAQWQRMTGSLAPKYGPGIRYGDMTVTGAHPMENVTWSRAMQTLSHYDLRLPTESEWEYAARARCPWLWWTGKHPSSLQGSENLADASAVVEGLVIDGDMGDASLQYDDSWPIHAPVDAGQANPFGLYQTHGNVMESCLGLFRRLDGGSYLLLQDFSYDGNANRVARGGSFNRIPYSSTLLSRYPQYPARKSGSIGMRPAMGLND